MITFKRATLVTGGSKRIGKAIITRLAKDNTNVIIHYNKSKSAALALSEKINKCKNKVFYGSNRLSESIRLRAYSVSLKKSFVIDCLKTMHHLIMTIYIQLVKDLGTNM